MHWVGELRLHAVAQHLQGVGLGTLALGHVGLLSLRTTVRRRVRRDLRRAGRFATCALRLERRLNRMPMDVKPQQPGRARGPSSAPHRDWRNCADCCPISGSSAAARCSPWPAWCSLTIANVGVPLVLKGIVDTFQQRRAAGPWSCVALLACYGALSSVPRCQTELRDVVFARVSASARCAGSPLA